VHLDWGSRGSGVPTSFVQSGNTLPSLVADKLLTEQHVMLLYHSNWSNCLHYTPVTTLNVPLRSPSLLLYRAHPHYLPATLCFCPTEGIHRSKRAVLTERSFVSYLKRERLML